MPTTTTAQPVAFTHTQDCEDRATGAAVRALFLELDGITEHDVAAAMSNNRRCQCGHLALTRTDNELRIARKQLRTLARPYRGTDWEHRDVLVDRIDALVAERAAIRAELGV